MPICGGIQLLAPLAASSIERISLSYIFTTGCEDLILSITASSFKVCEWLLPATIDANNTGSSLFFNIY
jgi:hypothetical protein